MSDRLVYTLRPGKFVDRALFVELLQYVDRSIPMRSAVYVGLGGPSMEDHRVLHGALGLKKMISIERDASVFAQQKFNRPLREIVCVQRDVKAFVDEFSQQLRRAKVREDARLIVWLDYEAPDELSSQLRTFQSLIGLVNDGDVIRITINAHGGSLGAHQEGETDAALYERRMEKLKKRFGDFLSEDLMPKDTQNARYPSAVLSAVKLAVLRATSNSGRTFLPLLVTQYADGQAMLSVTGIVLADGESAKFLARTGLRAWPHYSDGWANVEQISKAPNLTLRERMHVDKAVRRSGTKLPANLEYLTKLQKLGAAELLQLYRRYQRFLPQFQNVDL